MNEQLINISLSSILTISTVIYVVLTNRLVRESRKSRKFQETPFIVASISFSDFDRKVIMLKIKNIGLGYAQSVRFEVIKDYEWIDDDPLKGRGAFKNGISSFPPNYELNYILVLLKEGQKKNILENEFVEFKIKYENLNNETFSNIYKLSFNEIISQGYANPPLDNESAIVYYLKSISEEMKKKKENN